jgi:hypothetical protein
MSSEVSNNQQLGPRITREAKEARSPGVSEKEPKPIYK